MWMAAFQEDLQKLGWVEDRNIQIDIRWGAIDAQSRERIAKGCGPTFSLRRARGQVSEPQSMIVLGEPSIVLGEPSGLPIDQLLAFAAPCQLLSPPGGWNFYSIKKPGDLGWQRIAIAAEAIEP